MSKLVNTLERQILALLVFVALGSSVVSFILNNNPTSAWGSDWLQNFSTEMMGAIVTFGLFRLILGSSLREDERQQDGEERIKQLVTDLRNSENADAPHIFHQLRTMNALYDGSLNGANLLGANLPGANMSFASLEDTNLAESNLPGVFLLGANLPGANLCKANLQSAHLVGANLQDANLIGVNLKGANLIGANLKGTIVDETTTLPDGTNWHEGVDMTIFTTPSPPTGDET